MPGYRYSVDQAVLDVFVAVDEKERERLRAAFERLAAQPEQTPDLVSRAPREREISGKFFGHWLVRYWVDGPVKVVVVVECRRT